MAHPQPLKHRTSSSRRCRHSLCHLAHNMVSCVRERDHITCIQPRVLMYDRLRTKTEKSSYSM